MRALLIVNPRATSTTRLRRDVIASALASAVKLEVVETRYRGHATTLAASARSEGFGLVLTLGGDGTVNETVNGILAPRTDPQQSHNHGAAAPANSQPRAAESGAGDSGAGSQAESGAGDSGAGSQAESGAGDSGAGDSQAGSRADHGRAGDSQASESRAGESRPDTGTSPDRSDGGGDQSRGSGRGDRSDRSDRDAQRDGDRVPAAELPAFAVLPGGSANVFAGALGLARDPVDATGQILQALTKGRERTIGLGVADGRYFTFNSGIGLDAEVVRAVQGLRAHGRPATSSLYVRLALRQFYKQTDRSKPAVWVDTQDGHSEGQQTHGPVFLGIVSNTAPWTYLGGREVNANPEARFDSDLDVFALRRMSSFSTLYAVTQMLITKGGQLHGRSVLALHDQYAVTLRADRPVAFQIDGEYVGERELVHLRSVPAALRVLA